MHNSSVIALTDSQDVAGSIVWFSYSGAVKHDALHSAWASIGRDTSEIPDPPGPDTACLRAMNEHKGPRMLVRPLEGRAGIALVEEHAKSDDLDYAIRATARVNAIGHIDVTTDERDEREGFRLRDSITSAYRRHLFTELSTTDISGWVSRTLLPMCDALSLRNNGGFYFVPSTHRELWAQMTSAIRSCSNHAFHSVPAMRSEDAVEAILSSLRDEARSFGEHVWAELQDGTIGERALKSRVSASEEMRAKVARYEHILGVSLADLTSTLEQLEAVASGCAIKAHASEDYTDGLGSFADLL